MKLKNLVFVFALMLCFSACFLFGCANKERLLTVEDPNNFITEPLATSYEAGEKVTFKTLAFVGVNVEAYINGVSINDKTYLDTGSMVYWEFSFDMPQNDSTLTVEYDTYVYPEPASAVVLSSEIKNEIKEAYANKHNTSVSSLSVACFGVFNDCYALMVYCSDFAYAAVITYDNFGTVKFTYSCSNKMIVYNKGSFYSLASACENRLLTNSNIREVAFNVSSVSSKGVWALALSEEKEAEITDCYYEAVKEQNADMEKIVLSAYYGEFNGYYAVSIGIDGTAPYAGVVETIVTDGILFGQEQRSEDKIVFSNSFGIQLYKNGKIYTLKYAVENKLISLDDYINISEVNGFVWKG